MDEHKDNPTTKPRILQSDSPRHVPVDQTFYILKECKAMIADHEKRMHRKNARTEYGADFELFWKKFKGRWSEERGKYIKVNKFESWCVWQVMNADERQKAIAVADRVSGKYTPDPNRWLKRKMWDDFKVK